MNVSKQILGGAKNLIRGTLEINGEKVVASTYKAPAPLKVIVIYHYFNSFTFFKCFNISNPLFNNSGQLNLNM